MRPATRIEADETVREMADAAAASCDVCGTALGAGDGFRLDGHDLCPRHALSHPPMLCRSALTAVVIGTLSAALMQGNMLLPGDFSASFWWRAPLAYVLPFGTAAWGALASGRR